MEISKYLLALGVSNMAMNRNVVRELEMKLRGASEEELDEFVQYILAVEPNAVLVNTVRYIAASFTDYGGKGAISNFQWFRGRSGLGKLIDSVASYCSGSQ